MTVNAILNSVRESWRMYCKARQLAAMPPDPPLLILQAVDRHTGSAAWKYRTDIGPSGRDVWHRHISLTPICIVTLSRQASVRLDSSFGEERLFILRSPAPSWYVTICDGVIQHVSLSTDGVFSQNRLMSLSSQDLNALKEFHRRVVASTPMPTDRVKQVA